jgi:hypothetical protein
VKVPISTLIRWIDDNSTRTALEVIVATLEEFRAKFAEFKTELTAALARVDEDVAELRRKIAEGTISAADLDELQGEIDRIKAVDPDPDFPPATGEPGDDTGTGDDGTGEFPPPDDGDDVTDPDTDPDAE